MVDVRRVVCFLLFFQLLPVIATQSTVEQVNLLIKQLSSKKPSIRSQAAKQLAEFGSQAQPAVYPLIEALQDSSIIVRRNVALALGKIGIGAGESIPTLVQLLDDRDWTVRANVAFALGNMGEASVSAIPKLIQLIEDVNWEVCANAIKSLGQIGPIAHSAVPVLRTSLRSENEIVRNNSILALAEIGLASVPVLIEALSDKDRLVRRAAAFSLSRISQLPPTAIEALKEKLRDPEDSVKLSVAVVLAVIDPINQELTLPIIEKSCFSKDKFTSDFAIYSLKRIQQQNHLIEEQVDMLIQKLQHQQASQRYKAVITLIQMGPKIGVETDRVVNILSTKIDDEDQKVRTAIITALEILGSGFQAPDK